MRLPAPIAFAISAALHAAAALAMARLPAVSRGENVPIEMIEVAPPPPARPVTADDFLAFGQAIPSPNEPRARYEGLGSGEPRPNSTRRSCCIGKRKPWPACPRSD